MAIFCDLPAIAENSDHISQTGEAGKWRAVEYRTKLGAGRLLAAAEDDTPQPVTLAPELTGWYKLYIGLFDMCSENYLFLKLSGDEEYTPVRKFRAGAPWSWQPEEYMQELYWKCADLTGQKLIMAKPQASFASVSGLAWLRCEKMTEQEIARYRQMQQPENRCVQMHFDVDSFFDDRSPEKTEHFAKFSRLKHTNADFCSVEYCMMFDQEDPQEYHPLLNSDGRFVTGKYTCEEMFRWYVKSAAEAGIPLYAGERMSIANFAAPSCRPEFRKNFVTKNPQLHCVNRDGSTTKICSYAWPETRDYVIRHMLKMVEWGFEGITMIFHRGNHIGFEQPVAERFAALHPGVDMCRLPVTDARLHGVWCSFMTEFMRQAKEALDAFAGKHIKINVISDYGLETARNFGLDIEGWAREGLIDSVCQADMETWEDLTDCMSEEDPSLIDLTKYEKQVEDRCVIKRSFGTNVDKVCRHMAEYLALEETYGVRVYHVLPWVNTLSMPEYMEKLMQMKASGAKRFLAWNTNHLMSNLPEYHTVTRIGNESAARAASLVSGEDVAAEAGALQRYIRVLSLEGADMSQFYPNWRG